jgi:hypothetical protein
MWGCLGGSVDFNFEAFAVFSLVGKFHHDFIAFHAIDACERATGDTLISTRWLRSDALF